MNSYPPELLVQLSPVMFVAGLDPPTALPVPQSPKSQDPFMLLTLRLRDTLLAQRKVAIWQPDQSKTFQVLLVDKQVRFPPRKMHNPDDPQFPNPHSPLSPLTPSSPLHPDGLIAPIWIRKHTTLVPSVFVLFLHLYEHPPVNPRSPLDQPDPDREREREQEERRRDVELSAEVALRKKSTNERGIKLTVVLMASRKMLDDPTLDARLTFIRRQSGLDSRAALFVLSPVSVSELGDFVRSLQQALYEHAIEYYTLHSKRVRRKRNRHSQAVPSYASPITPSGSTGVTRPLRPEGWTVRYEYKMACFAEFRGESEVALKHYQDSYAMLCIMFGSTAILPPRTKRWAEAKVLADCINVKICKLYLYNNEHAFSLSHHTAHIRKFADFSRGWGIGEETFEFWSWMARQHRVLAELLEQGTSSTLVLPTFKPVASSSANAALTASQTLSGQAGGAAVNNLEADAFYSLGLNPSHALQHPGFYYYMAARCTEMRRERLLEAVDAEPLRTSAAAPPGFANEKKVDHLTIILELYTKSYELFKKYSTTQGQTQGRLTLWIAYRIAQTYYDSGKFDMAVRFFERIAKSYRREKWGSMLRPLLDRWYSCAQRLGNVELSVRLLIEMLGYPETEELGTLQEDLLAVLKSTVPLSLDEPMLVDLSESEPLFDSTVIFWSPEVKIGEQAAFQLTLTAPSDVLISLLPISSLTINFMDDLPPVVIYHSPSESDTRASARLVDLGHVSANPATSEIIADLRWQLGSKIIFSGTMTSAVPKVLKISGFVLSVIEGNWKINIPCEPQALRQASVLNARWLSSLDPIRFIPVTREGFSMATVRPRPHRLSVQISHHSTAYLDEKYAIVIEVANTDDRELHVVADVLLQPSEMDDTDNQVVFEDQTSSSLIKGIPFGVVGPGISVSKTLFLVNTGAAGDRTIDISIQSQLNPADTVNPTPSDGPSSDYSTSEVLQTIVVPTVSPIKVEYGIEYRRATGERRGLSDLETFKSQFWDDGDGGEAIVAMMMECTGPWGLELESVSLLRNDGDYAKVIECSTDLNNDDMFPSEYLPGDQFADVSRITLAPPEERDVKDNPIPGPGVYQIVWRRLIANGIYGPRSTSRFSLPPLQPPVDGLIALLNVPSLAKLHEPISMQLSIRNRHPFRSANVVVQLEPDPSDGFVVAGLRSGRVPILLPGSEEQLNWRLVPMECGHIKVPRIRVIDKRKAIASAQGLGGPNAEVETEGEVVRVVDLRLDRRSSISSNEEEAMDDEERSTVLVLP